MKKQTTIPKIRRVIMEYEGLYYQAMPVQEYRDLYPGKWKCGKCLRGVIRPIIGLWDAPQCRVCGAFIRDIRYNDLYLGSMFEDKVFRYSHAPAPIASGKTHKRRATSVRKTEKQPQTDGKRRTA